MRTNIIAAVTTAILVISAAPALAQRLARDPVSDQSVAAGRLKSGELRPLDELLTKASAVGRGEYLGVDFNQDSNVYQFKFMRPNGAVVAVDVDGRSGRVLRTQ